MNSARLGALFLASLNLVVPARLAVAQVSVPAIRVSADQQSASATGPAVSTETAGVRPSGRRSAGGVPGERWEGSGGATDTLDPTTTVIVHGWVLDGANSNIGPRSWMECMARAIVRRAGSGAIYWLSGTSGMWEGVPNDPGYSQSSHNIVLLIDWQADSNFVQGAHWGHSQAAAAAVFADIRQPRGLAVDLLTGRRLHFIGHSRGCGVVSELAGRMLSSGVPTTIDHITYLDPHPINGTLAEPESGCPNASFNWGDPVPKLWRTPTGTVFTDTYYRDDGWSNQLTYLDFDGIGIDGTAKFHIAESALAPSLLSFGHTAVHEWYTRTIATESTVGCLDPAPLASWFGAGTFLGPNPSCQAFPPTRSNTGYYYSYRGGGGRCELSGGATAGDSTILAGSAFARGQACGGVQTGGSHAGWEYHGGGGTGDIVSEAGEEFLRFGPAFPVAAVNRVHDRFWLPSDVTTIKYDYSVTNAGSADLVVELLDPVRDDISYVIEQIPLNATTAGWVRNHARVLPSWVPRGGTYRLRIRVIYGVALTARVDVDNIDFVPAPAPTSVNVAISSVSPNPAEWGDPVLVAGTATFNTGNSVSTGLAKISVGGHEWTTPVVNGVYQGTVYAPSTNNSYPLTVTVFASGVQGQSQTTLHVQQQTGSGQWTLGEHLTSRSVQGQDPWGPIGVTPAFGCDDHYLYVWMEFRDVVGPLTYRVRLYRPDGSYWGQGQHTIPTGPGGWWDWYRTYIYWDLWQGMNDIEGRWRAKIQVLQGSSWYTIANLYPVIQYDLTQATMCGSVGSNPYLPVDPRTTFYQDDPRATAWLNLELVPSSLDIRWDFVEPNGSIFTSTSLTTQNPGSGYFDWMRAWGWMNIYGNATANKCGRWRADVYIRQCSGSWERKYTDSFEILERPSLAPLTNATAPSGPLLAGTPINVQVSASDNTYLDRVELWYYNGTWQSVTLQSGICASTFQQQRQIGPFAAGQQVSFYSRAYDTSGNSSTSVTRTISIHGTSPVLYVKASAGAGGSGQSWSTAFSTLTTALDEARVNPLVNQIWVAQGTYTPDPTDRMNSFRLVSNVALYGGFVGHESSLGQRPAAPLCEVPPLPPLAPPGASVLDGDRLSNNVADPLVNREDDVNNILDVGDAINARVDGFVIRNGWAISEPRRGAGLLNDQGQTATVVNCVFERNDASMGGAVYSLGSPAFDHCVFRDNRVFQLGGAAVFTGPGSPKLVNCVVNGSYSSVDGGALAFADDCTPTVVNCTIYGSWVNGTLPGYPGGRGAAVYVDNALVRLDNCIVWGSGSSALGMSEGALFGPATPTFLDHCCVEGWTGTMPGAGCLGLDPLFVDRSGWPAFGAFGIVARNLRHGPSSPCIDAGNNGPTLSHGIGSDLCGLPRRVDDLGSPNVGEGAPPMVDIGAFEFTGRSCYANCDGSTANPPLTANDFACFINRYSAGDPYANCDQSTVHPVLTANDFMCFLSRFSAGCP